MQDACDRALSTGQHIPAKLLQPGIWRQKGRKTCGVCNLARGRSEAEGQSFEAEFRKYADLDRVQRASQHLELTWKVSKNAKPCTCSSCEGTGHQPCSWCNSTGAMRLGEYLFCSVESGCKPCPICRSKGNIPCEHCKGTGYRASWLSP
ncbi:g9401 [Coccomyxa elongata]